MAEGDTLVNAAIGAVVSIVLSFLPVSPAFGGAVAAYLQGGSREEGTRVGALSGAIAALPIAFLFAVVGGIFLGLGVGLSGPRVSFLGFAVLFVVVFVVAVVYSAVLGAIGGYAVVYLVEEGYV